MTINPFAVMQEEFDNTGMVFNPDNNKVLSLNAAGVVLWKAFERGCSIDEAAQKLTEEFEVDIASARQDAGEFAEVLRSKGLLRQE